MRLNKTIFMLCGFAVYSELPALDSPTKNYYLGSNASNLKGDRQLIGQGVYVNGGFAPLAIVDPTNAFTGANCSFRGGVQVISSKNQMDMTMYSDYSSALKQTGISNSDTSADIPIPKLGFKIPLLLSGASNREAASFDGKYHAHLYMITYQSALFTTNVVVPDLNKIKEFYGQFKDNKEMFYAQCGEGYVNQLAGIKSNIVDMDFAFSNSYAKNFFQHKVGAYQAVTTDNLLDYGETIKEESASEMMSGTLTIKSYTVGNPIIKNQKLKADPSISCTLNNLASCGGIALAQTLKSFADNLSDYDYDYYIPQIGQTVANTRITTNPIISYVDDQYIKDAVKVNNLNWDWSPVSEQQQLKSVLTEKYKFYMNQIELANYIHEQLGKLIQNSQTDEAKNIYAVYYNYYDKFIDIFHQKFAGLLTSCSPRANYINDKVSFNSCNVATTEFETDIIAQQKLLYSNYIAGSAHKLFLINFSWNKSNTELDKQPSAQPLLCLISGSNLNCVGVNSPNKKIVVPYKSISDNALDNVGASLEYLDSALLEEIASDGSVTTNIRNFYLQLASTLNPDLKFACSVANLSLWKYVGDGLLVPHYYGGFASRDPRLKNCPAGVQNENVGLLIQNNKLNPKDASILVNVQMKVSELPYIDDLSRRYVPLGSLLLAQVNGSNFFYNHLAELKQEIAKSEMSLPADAVSKNIDLLGYSINFKFYQPFAPVLIGNSIHAKDSSANLPQVSILNNQELVLQGCSDLTVEQVGLLPNQYLATLHCDSGNRALDLFVPDLNELIYLSLTKNGLTKANLMFK